MKLTVIGPWGGYPKANEASAGYLLEQDGYRLLIDCGSGVLSKLQNILQPEELDAVILTHYHPDHIADIGVLQHARLIQGFLGKEMPALPIYGHNLNEQEFQRLTYKNITKGIAYEPETAITVGPLAITFTKTIHPVPCFAMRFESQGKSLVFTADSAFKEEFISFSRNVDLLLCECNLYAGQDGSGAGHMTSREAGRYAREALAKRLVLTHLPHFGELDNLVKEASEEYMGPISLAGQFLTFEL